MTGSGQHLIGKEPFRIGVSYWPRRAALDLWRRFDVDEIQEDFSILSELGANLARVTLIWEDFQPDPASLRCSALAHLLTLCDAAASEGIRLELLLFAGPFGTPGHLPQWLDEVAHPSAKDVEDGTVEPLALMTHPVARRASIAFAQSIARTVGDHPAIWAYSLGDRPVRTAPERCRVADNAWLGQLSQSIRVVDPKHPLTCTLAGNELVTNAALRIDEVSSYLDHATIDSEGLADEFGQVDDALRGSFGCALTAALTGKPCLLQQRWHSPSERGANSGQFEASSSAVALLTDLHRVGAIGALMGSFSDLPGQDDGGLANGGHGLLTVDGQLHARAEGIKEFARSKPFVKKVPDNPVTLAVTTDDYNEDPTRHLNRLRSEFRTWLHSAPNH